MRHLSDQLTPTVDLALCSITVKHLVQVEPCSLGGIFEVPSCCFVLVLLTWGVWGCIKQPEKEDFSDLMSNGSNGFLFIFVLFLLLGSQRNNF